MNPKKILEWAENSIVKSFNFNFVHYLDTFSDAKEYYTDNGWKEFSNLLSKSGLLDSVTNNRFFLSPIISGGSVILYDGVVNGRHAWRIKIPVVLMFKTSENSINVHMQKKITVDIIVARVPNIENPENIGIDSLNVLWEK